MAPWLVGCLVGGIAVIAYWLKYGCVMANDSYTYIAYAAGHNVARPFRFRVGIPLLLRHFNVSERAITAWKYTSLAALAGCVALFSARQGTDIALIAALLVVGLPWFRQLVHWPAMTDQIAMFFCQVSVFFPYASIAGAVFNERVPVFSALYSWSLIPLAGLAVTLTAVIATKSHKDRGEIMPWEKGIVDRPLASAIQRIRSTRLASYFLPWGACLLAVYDLRTQDYLTLLVAYGQCIVAVDKSRLFQWAWPTIVPRAAKVVSRLPGWAQVAVVCFHFLVPWTERFEPDSTIKMERGEANA